MRRSARWSLPLASVVVKLLGVAVAVFFITIGSGVIRDGVRELSDDSALSARGRTAVGTVISKQTLHAAPGSTVTKMTVRFTAADGTQHEMWANGDKPVGARVRIRYDSAHPEVAVSESLILRSFFAGVMILAGIVLILGPPGLILKLFLESFQARRANNSAERPAHDPPPNLTHPKESPRKTPHPQRKRPQVRDARGQARARQGTLRRRALERRQRM
ncbi:hypothetical protein GCM10029978_018790 [Actinoallomurus acanthiterrae]